MVPNLYAAIAAICFGLVAPFVKMGLINKMRYDGYLITYGIALLLMASPAVKKVGLKEIFPNKTALCYGIIAGVICAFASKFSMLSLSHPKAVASVVIVIAAAYPLIASGTCIPLFKEFDRLIVPRFMFGAVLAIVGSCMVATSVKPPPKPPTSQVVEAKV